MAYALYGDRGSGSAAVELALAEIGADVRLDDVPLESAAQRSGRYEALNPQRKLPTLVTPEGEILTESAAILIVLADRHPDAALLPEAPVARAQAIRWLVFIAAEIYPVVEMIDYPERFQPPGGVRDETDRERLRAHYRDIWKRRWQVVEAAAADEGWFLEQGFSAVDLYAAVVSRWAQTDEWRPRHLPAIERIASAVAARPRCDAVWRRHFGDRG